MSNTYLLSKKLICTLCHKKFRGQMNRTSKTYICSTYSNSGGKECYRNRILESDILNFIKQYCLIKRIEYKEDKDFIQSLIDRIEILEYGFFDIYYKDNTFAYLHKNEIKYV